VKRNPLVLEKAGRGAEFVRSGELDADPFCALSGFREMNFCGGQKFRYFGASSPVLSLPLGVGFVGPVALGLSSSRLYLWEDFHLPFLAWGPGWRWSAPSASAFGGPFGNRHHSTVGLVRARARALRTRRP
jgi:hypothetical protein